MTVNHDSFVSRLGRRSTAAMSTLALLATLTMSAAFAGTLDPGDRYEHLGDGPVGTVQLLGLPNVGRALALQQNGDLLLVNAAGLVSETIGHVDVQTDCQRQGILSAAWEPSALGEVLYLTYIGDDDGAFSVGRIQFDIEARTMDFTELYSAGFPVGCENLGGGIGRGGDGKLYVLTGDFGVPADAGTLQRIQGKVLRMELDGSPTPGNLFGFVHAQGLRNPVRMANDAETGDLWFLDLGPGANDELNLIDQSGPGHYGWKATEEMGYLEGPNDPYFWWETPITPSGLAVYRAESDNLGVAGKILISSAGNGEISVVTPDLANRLNSTEQVLFTPDPTDRASLRDLTVLPDGLAYAVADDGSLVRLLSDAGNLFEPSRRESIVPMLVTKGNLGAISVAVERIPNVDEYGLYTGDLGSFYTHPDITDVFLPLSSGLNDAWSASNVLMDGNKYILMSAQNNRSETITGSSSESVPGMPDEPRSPGQLFTCLDCGGAAESSSPGGCAPTMAPLDIGLVGPGNPAPVLEFPGGDYFDCHVTQISISAEWCGPCRSLASDAENLLARYQDEPEHGLRLLEVLFEDISGNLADMATVERWRSDFNIENFPIYADRSRGTWNQYAIGGSIPQTWVVGHQGIVKAHIVGYGGPTDTRFDDAIEDALDD